MRWLLFALPDRWLNPPPPAAVAGWLGGQPYAHRGLHGERAGENSPAAFAGAIAAGLGIECDVRLSRDGRAIVFHDETLDRLTGRAGRIDAMNVGEITHVPLTVGGDRIPTLRDLLEQVAGRVPLLIEVKSRRETSPRLLCAAVRRDLEGYLGPVAVMSFDPRVGAWFAAKAPAIARGLVVTEEGRRTLSGAIRRRIAFWKSRAQFLAYDIRDLPSRLPAGQRRRGIAVLTWTVNSPSLRERARSQADAPIAEGAGLSASDLAIGGGEA